VVAKSLDIVVFLKLLVDGAGKSYAQLSKELGISASEIHAALRRGVEAGLVDPTTRLPLRRPLREYLLHGVRYAFPAKRGPVARGIPTGYAAPPIAAELSADDLPPVWADAEGQTRGYAVEPLYTSVPKAARSNPKLYELLALVDTLRIGRARERKMAEEELTKRLEHALAG
jgi:hypothetical protein